ncbi:glycerol uptake operon antiterminator [Gracilibacillus ureilyticus]|uniref:Glycerol uptake operon antiterminator regulatory protein n=1 Tax=Gracilibacillus ureilyticus TaxID=531814 RepID=A0A1H9ML81_9BACI|nr:glycerol-3-phosphate responsive antiterminator [Gracilibacillus ureilyticus]SER24289.1 glycerol uptake operon antiterminator [Gracilibacillus ureilyticus]
MKMIEEKVHLLETLKEKKLVAALKDSRNIEKTIKYKENLSAVLLMTGTILTVKRYVDFIQRNGLPVILHVEKIGGLDMDKDGIDFVKKYVKPAGIVTTNQGVIKRAKKAGLFVVQRVFLIDTDVYLHLVREPEKIQADLIEVMPSRAPDIIEKLSKVSPVPVITGGLLSLPEHARSALVHGAVAVSTSNSDMWKHDMNNIIN